MRNIVYISLGLILLLFLKESNSSSGNSSKFFIITSKVTYETTTNLSSSTLVKEFSKENKTNDKVVNFITKNYDLILVDASRGGGEYTFSLYKLYKFDTLLTHECFNELLQHNFSNIFSKKISDQQVASTISKIIVENNNKYC